MKKTYADECLAGPCRCNCSCTARELARRLKRACEQLRSTAEIWRHDAKFEPRIGSRLIELADLHDKRADELEALAMTREQLDKKEGDGMRREINSEQEAIWKQKFERLRCDLNDMEFAIEKQDFERSQTRAWDAAPEIFMSFCNDVVGDEETAIKLFGKGKYDVYKLVRTGDDPYETETKS